MHKLKSLTLIGISSLLVISLCIDSVFAFTPPPGYIAGGEAGGTISTDVNINIEGQGSGSSGEDPDNPNPDNPDPDNPNPGGPGTGDNPGNPGGEDVAKYKYIITYYYDDSIEIQRGEGAKGDPIPYTLDTPKTYAGHNWILDTFEVSKYISDIEEHNNADIYYTLDDKDKDGNNVPGGDGIADKYQDPANPTNPLDLYRYNVTYNYQENTEDVHKEYIMGQGTVGSIIPYQQTQTRSFNSNIYSFDSITVDSATVTPQVEKNKVELTYSLLSEEEQPPETNNKFNVTLDPANGEKIETQQVNEGELVVKPSVDPVKPGYTFEYWAELVDERYVEYDFNTPVDGNKALVAYYTLNSDLVEYKIYHHKQTMTGDDGYIDKASQGATGYIVAEIETLTGTPGESITATPKNYTGYRYDSDKSEDTIILNEHSDNTINLYYNRNQINITIDPANGTDEVQNITITYGGTVEKPEPDPKKDGYDFIGWFIEDNPINFTQPIYGDTTITAHYQLKPNDADYIVEHYQQNLEDDGYTLKDRDTEHSKENLVVTARAKQYIGFKENTNHVDRVFIGKVVCGDNPLTLKLYYDREIYKVTIDKNNGEPLDESEVKYGTIINKPSDPSNGDKIFNGWVDENGTPIDWDNPISKDVIIKADWVDKNDETYKYTINSYYNNTLVQTTGNGKLNSDIPYNKQLSTIYNGNNYTLVNKEVKSNVITTNELNNVVNLYYKLDNIGKDGTINGGDGVPDEYQVTIHFRAIYGRLSKYESVITKYDTNGNPSANGTATLRENDIPTATPNYGYYDGLWSRLPLPGIKVIDGETFIITYNRRPTYTGYPSDGTGNNNENNNKPDSGNGNGIVDIEDDEVVKGDKPILEVVKLNSKDHMAYIKGFPDGTVRPNANITRSEVAQIIVRLMQDDYRQYYYTLDNKFRDVNSGDWFNEAVSISAYAEIVKGYGDGTFRPNNNITRAEFATMVSRFFTNYGDNESQFTDISGHWAEEAINNIAAMGWITGYGDGTFRPNNYITRAEAVTIFNRILEREVLKENMLQSMKVWPDNKIGEWYYEAIQEASNGHDYRKEGKVNIWTALNNK